MSENDAELIAREIPEWLRGKRKISETTYGNWSTDDTDSLAQFILEILSE